MPAGVAFGGLQRAPLFLPFSDGKRQFSDDIGEELSGLAAARTHAVRARARFKGGVVLAHHPGHVGLAMMVTDAQGKKVLDIAFDRKAGSGHED